MVFFITAFLIAGLATHNALATPIPPPDCAFDTPNTCTVGTYPHHGIPGDPLPPRDASPCPLDADCGPIVVDPTPASTPSASATTCTPHRGIVPIGSECFESGPHAGQCISFECLDHPNTCGCPDAPPPAARKEKRTVDPALTSTSTEAPPSPTCTKPHGAIPIGEECFTTGPHAGQCISFECLDHPNTCGCPDAPPPAARKEKRTVDPAPTSTSTEALPSPTVCTVYNGPVAIGCVDITSGPEAGQCVEFLCLEHPNVCGCPEAPPPAPTQEKRSVDASFNCGLAGGCNPITVDPIVTTSTSTSSASLPSVTTCVVRPGGPIGSQCFTSGPHKGQCISFLCLDFPDTCGCPSGEVGKRSESTPSRSQPGHVCTPEEVTSGQCSIAIPRRAELPTPIGTVCELDGSGCVCLDCEKEKRGESEAIGSVCFANGTCTTIECLIDPNSSPTCGAQKEKRTEQSDPIGEVCDDNGMCTAIRCLDNPDAPGCATEKEKRSE
ncbi:MAG: hypothetical protein Q9175_007287, partial [Cornicularia normoerica]